MAQACFRANIPLVTIYTTLGDGIVVAAVNETMVTHLVTSEDLLPRLRNIMRMMPTLTHIIYASKVQTAGWRHRKTMSLGSQHFQACHALAWISTATMARRHRPTSPL